MYFKYYFISYNIKYMYIYGESCDSHCEFYGASLIIVMYIEYYLFYIP